MLFTSCSDAGQENRRHARLVRRAGRLGVQDLLEIAAMRGLTAHLPVNEAAAEAADAEDGEAAPADGGEEAAEAEPAENAAAGGHPGEEEAVEPARGAGAEHEAGE